jgi:hypothetical protein
MDAITKTIQGGLIMYSCGYCGCPCDEYGNEVETPKTMTQVNIIK